MNQNSFLFVLYLFSLEVISTNSKTSLWKLNAENTKIIKESALRHLSGFSNDFKERPYVIDDDPVFNIITSTVRFGQSWIKKGIEYYCIECNLDIVDNTSAKNVTETIFKYSKIENGEESEDTLNCGKPINFTYYDNLVGIMNRNSHPNVPEPQLSLIFPKSKKKSFNLEVDLLEKRLKKAKREKAKSVQLYNQIGNFWRIKGHSLKSIECYRKALAISPHNSEVLLNLARVLFTLQYLDDAIFLTRRSLEVQPPDRGAWQQYFTLGEIFKAYGHYQEASVHLKHTLELKPGFEPAEIALKEMDSMPPATIHVYTLVIIICLVLGVLLVMLSSVDTFVEQDEFKSRHFNKAMAMRSLRGFGISAKNGRLKKSSM